jgi:hypothetical protein
MRKNTPLLPPPAATILLYAADGLSVWRKNFSPSGNPRTPERVVWVSMFHELVKSPEGLRTLHKLAESGMRAWRCSPATVDCLKDAFHDITIRALMLATLEDFAATAREKIVLRVHEPTRQSPPPNPPPKARPQPQSPRPDHPTSAHRPRSRPGGHAPAPH